MNQCPKCQTALIQNEYGDYECQCCGLELSYWAFNNAYQQKTIPIKKPDGEIPYQISSSTKE